MHSGESANTNCIVFGLTLPSLQRMNYRNSGEYIYFNHYTTYAVKPAIKQTRPEIHEYKIVIVNL